MTSDDDHLTLPNDQEDKESETSDASPPPSKAKKTQNCRYRTSSAQAEPKVKKRSPNAFMIYSQEKRGDFANLKVTEIAKIIGAQWRALSEEEKSRYKHMAATMATT